MSWLKIDTDEYKGMISIDDKNYVLMEKDGKLVKHGSGLKGRHLPRICDVFIDKFCTAVLERKAWVKVVRQFTTDLLRTFQLSHFVITISIAKSPKHYQDTGLYARLISQIHNAGYRLGWGATIQYAKTVNGYKPAVLIDKADVIDFRYYQGRLAALASRILNKPYRKKADKKKMLALFGGTTLLEEYPHD